MPFPSVGVWLHFLAPPPSTPPWGRWLHSWLFRLFCPPPFREGRAQHRFSPIGPGLRPLVSLTLPPPTSGGERGSGRGAFQADRPPWEAGQRFGDHFGLGHLGLTPPWEEKGSWAPPPVGRPGGLALGYAGLAVERLGLPEPKAHTDPPTPEGGRDVLPGWPAWLPATGSMCPPREGLSCL